MSRAWTVLAAVALSLACSGAQIDGGPGSPVRLDTQAAVGWEPGGPYNLELVIYNATGYRMMLVEPKKESLQVKVFRPDGKLVCKTPSPTHKQYDGWWAKPVRAASGLKLEVDIWPYCRNLGPGRYRYEAVFLANPATGISNIVWTGTVGPQGGQIAIGAGLSGDETALAAALSESASKEPAAAEPAPATPAEPGTPVAGTAEPVAVPAAGEPAQPAAAAAVKPAEPSKPAAAASSPEQIRACVDRELSSRGLNAYGDPQGTKYEAPPVDEGGRILYVASRIAEIRVACKIVGF